MISALFIVRYFPKWFVHFQMSFCENSIRISCQIIFVNKHCPHSCPSPFNHCTEWQFIWDSFFILIYFLIQSRSRTGLSNRSVGKCLTANAVNRVASVMLLNPILKGHRHDWGQCLFTKIIWDEILIEFLQKVIQKCTNHFGKDKAINRAEITHKILYL